MQNSKKGKLENAFQIETVSEKCFKEAFGSLNEAEARNAPENLFLSGDETLLRKGSRVCLLGDETSSQKGLTRARKLAVSIAKKGAMVASGLNTGSSEAVLSAAIEEGGRVIGVLEDTLNLFYPRSLRKLGKTIGNDHLLISPLNSKGKSATTDVTLGGATAVLISDATVIVDAVFDSQMLKRAWEAIRLGRPLFICEELIAETVSSDWPEELIDHGAKVLTNGNIRDELIANLPEVSRAEFAAFTFDD